jgi:hypothetical protein
LDNLRVATLLPPDERYPNLRFLNWQKEPLDKRRLIFILTGTYQGTPGDVGKLDKLAALVAGRKWQSSAGHRVADLALNPVGGIGAISAIIEDEYIDRDVRIAYGRLYAKSFRDYPRRTIRVHFFGPQQDGRELSYDDLLDEDRLQSSYLGFCILAPSGSGVVGRTVIPPPRFNMPDRVPCLAKFSINLAGAKLFATGAPFIEQDGRISACSSAASWMSTAVASKNFGSDLLSKSVAEITQLATTTSVASQERGAAPGLSVDQIVWALSSMGYGPMVHILRNQDEAAETILRYVDSRIPPILVFYLPNVAGGGGYHAVTAIGYTILNPRSVDPSITRRSSLVFQFIIQDDQQGPYLTIRLVPGNANSKGLPGIQIDPDSSLRLFRRRTLIDWYHGAYLRAIIAPSPMRDILRPEEAASKGEAALRFAFGSHEAQAGLLPQHPVFNTFLVTSNDFKRSFHSLSGRGDFGEAAVGEWYRGSMFTRYLWVTEVADRGAIFSSPRDEARIIADVTIDPSSTPKGLDFLTLHVPHLFCRLGRRQPPEYGYLNPIAVLPSDNPYPPYRVRMEF